MYRALFLALAAPAVAFVPPAQLPAQSARVAARSAVSMADSVEMSESLPMLPRPMKLKGWTGDVGFDPLGLSEWVAVEWLRESELKHSRVAMLAVTGYIATDCGFKIPGEIHDVSSLQAHNVFVANGAFAQIFFWLFLIEALSYFAIVEMLEGSGRKPGDFGFDPLGFSKGKDISRLELAELKNGRLAMLAFSGIIHHYFITGKGPVELMTGA